MRIPDYRQLERGMRWLRSRLTGGVLILGYHRVSEVRDPYGLCVRPDHFEQQLDVLKQHATIISLTQLADGLQRRSLPSRSVVLTFDDGYLDNLQFARPLLVKKHIPATLFAVTGYLGELFWWDELARLLLDAENAPPQLTIELKNQTFSWRVANTTSRQEAETVRERQELLRRVYQRLLYLPADDREDALAQLRQQAHLPPELKGEEEARAMTPAELRQMAEGELMTIGAHSVTHPVLTRMPAEEQQREISQSRECLQEIVGRPVTCFSYPNGSGDDTTRRLVRQAGFRLACASFNDLARPGSDLFCLPRFWVPDWNGKQFIRWLPRWLGS